MRMSEKNEAAIRKKVKKSFRKIVKLYTEATKEQHKKASQNGMGH